MGVDCVFIAENVRGVTPEEVERDLRAGVLPNEWGGSCYRDIPGYCEFFQEFIVLHSGCRINIDGDYQQRMIDALQERYGGRAGVYPDVAFDECGEPGFGGGTLGWIRREPEEAWAHLQDLSWHIEEEEG